MESLLDELRREHDRYFGWSLACCAWQADVAEEVLQEAYLRVLDGRAKFAGRSRAGIWFCGVIRRVAAESRRARARRNLLGLRLVGEQADELAVQGDALEGAQADESVAALRAALLQLSQRQREILHLVFYSELTVEEAAEALGISTGSARTHYHRGKQRLGELLGIGNADERRL